MAAAMKQYFLRFLFLTEYSPPSFKVRGFVIYWLFQNGANKNQHQYSYQRETISDKFVYFSKLVRQKSQ